MILMRWPVASPCIQGVVLIEACKNIRSHLSWTYVVRKSCPFLKEKQRLQGRIDLQS